MEINREQKTVKMERVFDAPAELVWKVYTNPDLIPQWWGIDGTTTVVDKMDFRIGGAWRFVQKGQNGEEYGFRGEYKDIVPGKLIKQTFEFELMAGHILTETLEFIEENGKTRLVNISYYDTLEDLEGMVASGMEKGANETWDRLEKLLKNA